MNPSPLLVSTNFMVAQPPTDEQKLASQLQPLRVKAESVEDLQNRIFELEQELELVRMKGKLLSQETDLFRQRRIVYWSDRFRNTFDAWNLMNPGFLQLKDDTAIFNSALGGFRLQPSLSLLRVAFLTYVIDLKKPNLKSILLAPIVDVPLTSGELCIRVFEAPDKFLTSSIASVADIRDDKPLQFNFDPIETSNKPLIIRVHVQGVDAPVRIFEMRKYGLAGFGRQYNKLFAGFEFAE